MTDTNSYRRKAFPNRPWITGALWDKYASKAILHCDAYVLECNGFEYLLIDWREGGRKQVALDCYLIEPDGLSPVWEAGRVVASGVPQYWTKRNHATMRRVHKTVLGEAPKMLALGQGKWTRVVAQAHYVHAPDTDCEIKANAYKERKPYKSRNALPDIL